MAWRFFAGDTVGDVVEVKGTTDKNIYYSISCFFIGKTDGVSRFCFLTEQ